MLCLYFFLLIKNLCTYFFLNCNFEKKYNYYLGSTDITCFEVNILLCKIVLILFSYLTCALIDNKNLMPIPLLSKIFFACVCMCYEFDMNI